MEEGRVALEKDTERSWSSEKLVVMQEKTRSKSTAQSMYSDASSTRSSDSPVRAFDRQ